MDPYAAKLLVLFAFMSIVGVVGSFIERRRHLAEQTKRHVKESARAREVELPSSLTSEGHPKSV